MTWIAHQFTTWPRVPSEALDVRTRVIAEIYSDAASAAGGMD